MYGKKNNKIIVDDLRGNVRSAKMRLKVGKGKVSNFEDTQSTQYETELKNSVNRGDFIVMYYDGCSSKINIGNAERWIDCYCLVPKGFDRHSWNYSKPHWAAISLKLYGVVYITVQNTKLYKYVVY
jgi:hypothetical protein